MQGARPVRTAGFVLIGVAVVAVGLGVFALTSNGSGQAANGRPPVTSTTTAAPPATTTTHPKPTTTTQAPTTTPSYPSGQTTTVAPPPTSATAASPLRTVDIRVYNNSLIHDLAANAAQDFRNAGYNVVFVGAYPQGIIPHSTAYYTSAPGEQQVATQLAQQFGMRVAPRFPGIAAASPGVIVILTKDFNPGK
ncbi:MAG TPA: LytR C-terminal domain-containing protein [Pseudonocardiaceae bacterium]|jgi:hypothetical protein|nr:LytR C-terminal domain-containing protein [Pseudonocardiaceae bacterium]